MKPLNDKEKSEHVDHFSRKIVIMKFMYSITSCDYKTDGFAAKVNRLPGFVGID